MKEKNHSRFFGAPKALAFLPLALIGAALWFYIYRQSPRETARPPAPVNAQSGPFSGSGARPAQPPGAAMPSLSLEIKGPPAFVNQVTRALRLVSEADRDTLLFLKSSLYTIRNENKTDFYLDNGHPVAAISENHAFRSRTWCAGVIAHQAWHAWYALKSKGKKRKAPPVPGTNNKVNPQRGSAQPEYKGLDAIFAMENRASQFQLDVLRKIGAPAAEIQQLVRRAPRDFATGHDGNYSLRP